jgi:hypothetical protein
MVIDNDDVEEVFEEWYFFFLLKNDVVKQL